jgi:undecaprenyl-diphosphatase
LKDAYEEVPNFYNSENIKLLAIGIIVAFVVGLIAIKTFVALFTKYGLKPFGYYRIVLGAIIVALYFGGVSLTL